MMLIFYFVCGFIAMGIFIGTTLKTFYRLDNLAWIIGIFVLCTGWLGLIGTCISILFAKKFNEDVKWGFFFF